MAKAVLSGIIDELVIWDKVKSNYASGVRHGLEKAVKVLEDNCFKLSHETEGHASDPTQPQASPHPEPREQALRRLRSSSVAR